MVLGTDQPNFFKHQNNYSIRGLYFFLNPLFLGQNEPCVGDESQTGDAETYATIWMQGTGLQNRADVAAEFDKWMAYYEEQGIKGMGLGLITMRRKEGAANWFRAEDSPDKMSGPCGEVVERGFALMDFLREVPDDAGLLDTRLQDSPDILLERQYAASPQGW